MPKPEPSPPEPSPELTVLVVMRPAGRRRADAASTTAAHVGELAPSASAASRLAAFFAEAGCTVGPLVGISFSLTVPGAQVAALLGDEVDGEFARSRIPDPLRKHVAAIVHERPIDFGPVSF